VRRLPRVARGGVLVGWLDDVDKMMRDSLLIVDRNLVCSNVETAIDGGRIAGDDFAAEMPRERDRQRTLSRGSRSDDGNEWWRGQSQSRRAIAYTVIAVNARYSPSCSERFGGRINSRRLAASR
jgi:hypothetical protein